MRLLEVEGLTKRFGGLLAVNGCSLWVEAGEVHALIGPNGAGKTTLINLISGTLRPSQGRIFFEGQEITRTPAHERVHRGLARTFQITNLFRNYTVRTNLELAVQARSGSSFRFFQPVSRERALTEEALEVARRVGLEKRFEEVVGKLSHGEQRALEVAMALASRPKLLLLDEPTAGMGFEESERMVELIASLAREFTILLVEHDMQAVFRLAKRISVLVYGQVIATGTPEEIRANPEVHRAYLGDEVEGYGRAFGA
ncbi:ABC transporter ATP-binding protein [Meiothermus sp. QL-1]|uniref:ABC transporter ATP-binding protein n=1 Tax=Meiothermus sp. QL-1 TaxID=2058095 RepID=UPI000E0C9290|nr:ABC transporter ATP-binding protein [Meiothermus sp. QL-1]RDI94956.1 ABC transporter ATP-binding protein [Meiothermus sp. QL-1]